MYKWNSCSIILGIDIYEDIGDIDNENKCEHCGKTFKNLKKHIRTSHQIPKIQKDNENLAGDEEYKVEKVLGKRFGKKGTIGKKHALKKYNQFTQNTSCFWDVLRFIRPILA